jgi:hypothetical protein
MRRVSTERRDKASAQDERDALEVCGAAPSIVPLADRRPIRYKAVG